MGGTFPSHELSFRPYVCSGVTGGSIWAAERTESSRILTRAGSVAGQEVGDSSDKMLPVPLDHAVEPCPCPLLHLSSAVTIFIPSDIQPPWQDLRLPCEGEKLFHKRG